MLDSVLACSLTACLVALCAQQHGVVFYTQLCASTIFFLRQAAVVISGTELARQIHREIQRDVEELVAQGNMRPHLGVVLVGDDPASRTYVRNKTRAASILGIGCYMRFTTHKTHRNMHE